MAYQSESSAVSSTKHELDGSDHTNISDTLPDESARFSVNRLGRWAIVLLLIVMFGIFSALKPDLFFTGSNVRVMVIGQATTLLLAMAVIVPLRAGDFDLSVASVMVVTACLVGWLVSHGIPALAACILAVLVGPVVGVVNGMLVVRCGINSFIATLGMVTVGYGVATAISGGTIVSSLPAGLVHFTSVNFLALPMPVWIGWLVALLVWYLFEFTPAGRYLLFIGGSRSAASLAGLRVPAYRQAAFVFSGTLSAVTGLLYAGTLGAVDPSSASSYLLPPITAVFLGASVVQIGRFNVIGSIVGIYLLAIGITGLQLLGVQDWISNVFDGGVLIIAVLVGILLQGRERSTASTGALG